MCMLVERRREQSILAEHASRTHPELTACEAVLKCAIEGIDKDKILIRFTHIDPADLTREFSIVIDVSARLYKGEFLVPSIQREDVALRPK